MVSLKLINGLKIGFSVLFRLTQLGFPPLTMIVLSSMYLYWYLDDSYRHNSEEIFSLVIYTIAFVDVLLILVIISIFHNNISIFTIFIIDIIPIIVNIIYLIYSSKHIDFDPVSPSIGIGFHVITILIILIWSAIPVICESGPSGLFKTRKFIYGCLFIAEPEKGDLQDTAVINQRAEDGDFEMNDLYPKRDVL